MYKLTLSASDQPLFLERLFIPLIIEQLPVDTLQFEMQGQTLTLGSAEVLVGDYEISTPSLLLPFAIYLSLQSPTSGDCSGWILKHQIGEHDFRRLSRWVVHHR